ncbi:hypothetical protein PHJA_001406100 [Phtheirospermum japonicum]|uniref:SP-RING-type domain-containing protein n=1 Tax=Phtheirospermum japonicum TaxID=374723 RepID=A0A830C0V1_9LAMI|nr:hypothetical protein PHJA_001406100 [Phtheirospermum japonicum]
MAGTAVTPSPVTGISVNGGGGGASNSNLSASDVNSIRMSAVMDRLSSHFIGSRKSDTLEFLNLCLSLARHYSLQSQFGFADSVNHIDMHCTFVWSLMIHEELSIDYSIGNNEVPNRSQELPSLVKQVCKNNTNTLLQASVMVLMISIKNACQTGWFSGGDSEELSNLANKIGTDFCMVPNFSPEPSGSHSVISTITSRYYPRMKMGHIFTFIDVKPGYEAYVRDFQISKNTSSAEDKIRLFVVQTDNIETSSCLVTPAKVNILLNGKGVERRTNVFVDTGPQIPTTVNSLLKYGTNLIQAVGEFTVAFMSEVPNPDSSALQAYEQHAPATVESVDSEVIVGSSRISLNCPISFRKIKTPVKGHSCKHIQILKETGPNVTDVLISSDGSWNDVTDSDDTIRKPGDTTSNTVRDESPQPADVFDLTETDDAMNDIITSSETIDRKNLPNPQNLTTQSNSQDDYWSAMFLSTFGMVAPNVRPNASQVAGSVLTSPVTDGALDTIPVPQNMMQLQQYQFVNSPVSNEYGRFPSLPRNVTRTPTAVQALPAQAPTSHLQRSYTNSANVVAPNSRSAASQQNTSSYPSARPPQQKTFRVPNVPQATSQSPRLVPPSQQSSNSFSRPQSTTQQSQLIAAANKAVQMSFEPTRSIPSFTSVMSPRDQRSGNPGIASQPFTRTDGYDPTAEMSWRPVGRMRGALSGQAYAEAYNQAMNRPIQQAQGVRPIPNVTGGAVQGVPPGTVHGIPVPNYPSVSSPLGSDVMPPDGDSSGMN